MPGIEFGVVEQAQDLPPGELAAAPIVAHVGLQCNRPGSLGSGPIPSLTFFRPFVIILAL